MDTLLLLLFVVAVFVSIYTVRSAWMRRACSAVGLSFEAGPSPDQRVAWRALARWVHGYEPTTWGHTLRGRVDGAELALQEQELKPTVSSNRSWHTLVAWTLPEARMPVFGLDRASEGRGWLRDSLAPLVNPAIQALGGTPEVPANRMPEALAQDTAFCRRFSLDGPDAAALQAHFTPARREALSRWDPTGMVASDGQNLLWLRPGRAGPTQLAALLDEARALRRNCAEG
jgi:hypothetical protein